MVELVLLELLLSSLKGVAVLVIGLPLSSSSNLLSSSSSSLLVSVAVMGALILFREGEEEGDPRVLLAGTVVEVGLDRLGDCCGTLGSESNNDFFSFGMASRATSFSSWFNSRSISSSSVGEIKDSAPI